MLKDENLSVDALELQGLADERLCAKNITTDLSPEDEETQRLLHELQVHQVEMEMQNEELRKSRDERQKVEDLLGKYSDLYDFAPVGYFNLDHSGIIRAVNLTGAGFLGVERSLLNSCCLDMFISKETRPVFHDFLDRVFANETKETCQVVFLKEIHSPLFVQIEAMASKSREECRAVVIDITGHKLAEQELRRAKTEWERTFASVPDLIAILDNQHRVLRVNEAMARRLGLKPEECVGLPCYEAVHGTSVPPRFCPHLRTIEDGHEHIEELHVDRFGGDFLVTTTPLLDEKGEIIGSVHISRDITEKKRMGDALKELNVELETRISQRTEELAATIENLQVEIDERKKAEERALRLNRLYAVLSETNQAIVHAKDRDTLFNDFCRIAVEDGSFKLAWVGLVDEESGDLKVAAADGAIGYLEDLRITVNEEPAGLGPTGISVRNSTHYICNDFLGSPLTRPWHERGRAHAIRASASIALKQEGKVIGALTLYADQKNFFDQQQVELLRQMGADVSFALDNIVRENRRQEAERALREETIERLRVSEELLEKEQLLILQSRQAAMGEMINHIAHQWRQPLNNISITVQALSDIYHDGECSGEYLDDTVNQIVRLIQHMSQTIDDFRNFFRPDREMRPFDLKERVCKTLTLVKDSFKVNNINVDLKAEEGLLITGYPNEYCQVLLNILNNASDALVERNVVSPQIGINLFRDGKMAVTTISDNAGGIPATIIDRIFEPYFTTKVAAKGTGVGLYMSRTIIENHMNGKISVRNTDKGAEFRIEVAMENSASPSLQEYS